MEPTTPHRCEYRRQYSDEVIADFMSRVTIELALRGRPINVAPTSLAVIRNLTCADIQEVERLMAKSIAPRESRDGDGQPENGNQP
jgi:hypothetical protein